MINLVWTRKLKRGIKSLFHSCVNAMERQPYWRSHVEVSNHTFGFGTSTLLLLCETRDDNHYARVMQSTQERQLTLAC